MLSLRKETGECVLDNLENAQTFFTKLKGLMFLKSIPRGTGMLFRDCKRIHTHFMKFELEIIYVNEDFEVLDLEYIKPGKIGKKVKNAVHVIEVSAGGLLCDVAIGDKLNIIKGG